MKMEDYKIVLAFSILQAMKNDASFEYVRLKNI